MTYKNLLRSQILSLPIYQPGKPIDLFAREMGFDPETVLKLASNENPLGPSPKAQEAMMNSLDQLHLYPDNSGYHLVEKLSQKFDLHSSEIVLAAGSNEIFYRLCDLFVEPEVETVMGEYSFVTYRIATLLAGGKPVFVPMPDYRHDLNAMREAVTEKTRIVFLPNPNNPTGTMNSADDIIEFVKSLPEHVIFCYDEAYREYESNPVDLLPLMRDGKKIVATRTFSKIYGLAGLRMGYGYCEKELASYLNQVRAPFNTTSLGQIAAIASLDDDSFVKKSREMNEKGLAQLESGFDELGLSYVSSCANFILVRFENTDQVYDLLTKNGIIVRPVKGYDLPSFLRISVGLESQNARLLKILKENSI